MTKQNGDSTVTFVGLLSTIMNNASACYICRAVPYR